jgi:hypothetical protein
VRYTVPGWPSSLLGHSAVTPHMNRMAGSGAQEYKREVVGQPGTQPIPVDTSWIPSPDVGDKAQSGLSRSTDAPAYFLPNLYYARPDRDFWPGAGMPVARVGNALMPVPATDPRGIPARLSRPINQRGGRQIQATRPNPTWAAWRTGG